MAISRKVIVSDFDEVNPHYIYGSAAVILALSIAYYLIALHGAPAKPVPLTASNLDGPA